MTIIISGHARGGTTCVTRIVKALSVNILVSHADSKNMEDVPFSELIEAKEWDKVQSWIDKRNERHTEWGFKRPFVLQRLGKEVNRFRSPKLILVTRDIQAITESIHRYQLNAPPEDQTVLNVFNGLCREVAAFQNAEADKLVVSYESCMLRTEEAVQRIADFLGVRYRTVAAQQVIMNDPRYKPHQFQASDH